MQPALPKRPLLPPLTFMNLPEVPEHGPLMVLLFDALNTPLPDQLNARAQMLEFLKKSSGRRIAILTSATGSAFCKASHRILSSSQARRVILAFLL